MKTIRTIILLALVAALCMSLNGNIVTASPLISQIEKPNCPATLDDNFVENEILIITYPQWNNKAYTVADFTDIDCIYFKELISGKDEYTPSRISLLRLDENANKQDVLDAIKQLERRNDVFCAEPNYFLEMAALPNDQYANSSNSWAIDKISLDEAWNIATGSSSVLVGVIDSGINASHPDLSANVNTELSRGFASVGNTVQNPLQDTSGHGTHVAGIIGAVGNNSIGIAGVCWNVQLVSLRVSNSSNQVTLDAIVQAINYAVECNIPILNMSLGFYDTWEGRFVLQALYNYNGLVVCAAGNDALDNDAGTEEYPSTFPASCNFPNIISVGASTLFDNKWVDSNYGATTVDIFAPGNYIYSTYMDSYSTLSGTSMAAPYVTGVAALLLSEYPDMTTEQLKSAILNHADSVQSLDEYCVTGGRLNAYSALAHNWSTEYGYSESGHGYICADCEYFTKNRHTFVYSATNSVYSHERICGICSYTETEAHNWISSGFLYRCSKCGMISEIIPGIHSVRSSKTSNKVTIGTDYYEQINDSTYLCFVDGQFYEVKATSLYDAMSIALKTIQS